MKSQGANPQNSHFKNNLPFMNSHGACKSRWLYVTGKVCPLVPAAAFLY